MSDMLLQLVVTLIQFPMTSVCHLSTTQKQIYISFAFDLATIPSHDKIKFLGHWCALDPEICEGRLTTS
jgi:hypothetical protein